MKNARKIIAALLCVVMIAVVFCGCNINITVKYDGASAPASTEPAATTQPAAPATTQPAATDPATTQPAATDPASTEPAGSDPATTQPAATDPAPAPANPSTPEEILNVYKEVYKNTKADGSFRGTSHMSCTSVVLNGKENSLLRSTADKFMGGDTPDQVLPPDSESNPYYECDATVDDISEATWTDNGDGTATIVIKPKETVAGMKFTSSTGKFFNVMEDVASALESVPVVSWSEGDANSNTTLTTSGTVTVTYDTSSMKITKADYDLITKADVVHLNVLMFKDISGTAMFDYDVVYPS